MAQPEPVAEPVQEQVVQEEPAATQPAEPAPVQEDMGPKEFDNADQLEYYSTFFPPGT